jgi:hypothetical protein
MSRGPGRIERALAAIFDAEPENAFTSEELCARIYSTHGVPIQTKHHISLIRAAKTLAKRRPEIIWFRSQIRGSELVFARQDNVTSYTLGQLKRTWGCRGWDDDELRAILAAPSRFWAELVPSWARDVEIFLAARDGDIAKTMQLRDAAERERVAWLTRAFGTA